MASDTTTEMKWSGKEVLLKAARRLDANAERVGIMLEKKATQKLSGSGGGMIGPPHRRRNRNPSKPGQPPRVLHGRLRGSLAYSTKRTPKFITITLGANTVYARHLELGKPKGSKTDSKIGLAARPYLRPTIRENRKKAIIRLTKGLFR